MAMKIWKYPLQLTDDQTVSMPLGAQILHVAEQHEEVCLWALVNPEVMRADHAIRIIGSGQAISDDPGKFVGTFMMHGGSLVFHVFSD